VSTAITGSRCISDWQKHEESLRSKLAQGRTSVTKLQIKGPWNSELVYQIDYYLAAMNDSILCTSALRSQLESALTIGHHESFNASLATKYFYDLATDSTTPLPDKFIARTDFVLSAKYGFESLRDALTQPLARASRCEAAMRQAELEKSKLIFCAKQVHSVVDQFFNKTILEQIFGKSELQRLSKLGDTLDSTSSQQRRKDSVYRYLRSLQNDLKASQDSNEAEFLERLQRLSYGTVDIYPFHFIPKAFRDVNRSFEMAKLRMRKY
jgi:hypothetical protein